MTELDTGRLQLEYDTFGDPDDPALLLVMGFACQMTVWPERFCQDLAERGFFVIRFDNRDVGLSQKYDQHGKPDVRRLLARRVFARSMTVPYTLDDLAADAISLLDKLGVESAHVVGMSMGGMIAQLLAIKYPARVRSLTSWASMCGKLNHLILSPRVTAAMLKPPVRAPEARVEAAVEFWRMIGSPAFPTPDDDVRQRTRERIERTEYMDGAPRQFAAIIAAPDRSRALAGLRLPALVIHGDADLLVPLRGGRDTARAIPGARLQIIKGYGHDLPDALLPRIRDMIVEHAHGADLARSPQSAAQ